MQVTVVHGEGSLIEQYGEEWRALCVEGPCHAPFYSPEWARAYHEAFAPTAELVFLLVRDGERLRGLLPLIAGRWKGIPWGRRWLRSMANVHAPRFDVIHGAGDCDQVMEALVAFLQTWRGWDVIQCRVTPANGVFHKVAEAMHERGAPMSVYGSTEVPYVDLAETGSDIDTIVSRLSRNRRSQMRRALKRLDAHGNVRNVAFTADCSLTEVREQLAGLYCLEASGWKGEAGTAIIHDPRLRSFYGAIVDVTHASSDVYLFRVEANGEPVAMELLIGDATRLYSLKYGIDEGLRESSPGLILRLNVIAYAARSGFAEHDLGGKAEAHKLMWTEQSHHVQSYVVFRPTPWGRLAHKVIFGLAPWLRSKAPNAPIPSVVKRFIGE